jgi:transposase InsO family protein
VADITQQRTGEGWLYLAVILDTFSRRVVRWSMAENLRTELVLDACELLDRHAWPTKAGLRTAIFDFIEVVYNRQRRHSTLAYATPVTYEQQHPSSVPQPNHRVHQSRATPVPSNGCYSCAVYGRRLLLGPGCQVGSTPRRS